MPERLSKLLDIDDNKDIWGRSGYAPILELSQKIKIQKLKRFKHILYSITLLIEEQLAELSFVTYSCAKLSKLCEAEMIMPWFSSFSPYSHIKYIPAAEKDTTFKIEFDLTVLCKIYEM